VSLFLRDRPTFPVWPPQSDAQMIGNEAAAASRPATREARLAIFADAVEIIAAEYSRPIRINEVSRRVATSPRQLQRVFADVGGRGFREHLRAIRMAHATEFLATTDLPMKEIARRVGYDDPSQFSKAFKHTYGVSPSKWRATGGDSVPES
jgi:AraC family transcriptional regulator of adaptative response / methylphosphotriester-DNA alkyltransferase methyltransferase